jgi:hypothetical protein
LKPNIRNNRLSRIETGPNRQEKAKQEQANVNSQIHGQEKSYGRVAEKFHRRWRQAENVKMAIGVP